jgi:integrase
MLRDANLPASMRLHDLRHFTASALIQNGQSVKTVQAVLGHSSATKTLDIYGHLWPDAEDNVKATMDRTFMSAGPALRLAR